VMGGGNVMPVRNTFIDYGAGTDVGMPQLLTAPGKFVGRLSGFAVSGDRERKCQPSQPTPITSGIAPKNRVYRPTPATSDVDLKGAPPTGGACTRLGLATLIPETFPKGVPQPPTQFPPNIPAQLQREAADVRGGPRGALVGAPPIAAPHLPPDLASIRTPPPPQASPVVGSQRPERRALLAEGSLIEVTSMGQVGVPPRCAPPSYSIGTLQTPSGSMPPPMHTPVCATPANATKIDRSFSHVVSSTPMGCGAWPETPY